MACINDVVQQPGEIEKYVGDKKEKSTEHLNEILDTFSENKSGD